MKKVCKKFRQEHPLHSMTPSEFLATCTSTKKEKEMEEKAKATEAVSRRENKNKRKVFFLALVW